MRKLLGTVAMVGLLAVPGAAQAQAVSVVGGLLAYHTDLEAVGVGAYFSLPLTSIHPNLSLKPDFTFYFPDGGDYWELNGDAVWRFDLANNSQIIPFALGGISIAHASASAGGFSVSSTDVGLNLGGGVIFPLESIRPAVGAKFEIQDNTGFVIFGGVGFPLG
jgi:opacity protein-like surface antigen